MVCVSYVLVAISENCMPVEPLYRRSLAPYCSTVWSVDENSELTFGSRVDLYATRACLSGLAL